MRDKRFFSDEWYADKYDYQNEDSILAYSKKLEGKTLRDVLSESEVKEIENDELDKGEFGKILERYYFGLELNSSPEPDFSDIGLELKVTPCKVNNKKQLIIPYTLDNNDMRFATNQGFNSGDQFYNYLKDSLMFCIKKVKQILK